MNLKALFATTMIATTLFATTAHAVKEQPASNRSIEDIYKQCGLGGIIFGKTSPLLAIISNVTWDLGTTAATSDASSQGVCYSPRVTAAVYLKTSFKSVEQDLVVGQGEHMQALNKIAGCSATSNSIRSQYAQYAQSTTYSASPEKNADALYSIVNHMITSQSCVS